MARPTPWAALLLAATVCLGAGVAGAQGRRAPADREEADGRQRALDLLDESAALYDAGRFAEAAERLRAAHALHPEPALLYNLGRALDSGGEEEQALDAYARYLEAQPEAERRASVEARMAVLREQLAREDGPERAVDAPQAEPEQRSLEAPQAEEPSRLGPILVLSGGAGALAAGLAVGVAADARLDDARDAPDHRRRLALEDEAQGLATAANVLFVVGGVLAAVGLTWWLVQSEPGDGGSDGGPALGLELGPATACLHARLRL